jgi:cysteine desulfurase
VIHQVRPKRHPVYLDNHATTPVDPRVLEAMLPYFGPKFGNAASRQHRFGWEAERAVEEARRKVAALIGAGEKEIVFTSGATESDNLAIKGVAEISAQRGNHIVTCVTEHNAVLDVCRRLEKRGCEVTCLPVAKDGLLDLGRLRDALTERTVLVTVMAANNEIGVLQPIREIGAICRERSILFHSDAVQAAGKVPLDVTADSIDLASLSAHKMYGPKGVGALYVRRGVRLSAQMDGGGHERGMRSGTLNVPAIVGFGEACEIARREMREEGVRLARLRDRLKARIQEELEQVHVNGSMERRLPNNLNMSFAYVDGESLMMGLDDVAVSTGSACTSATLEPSHVIKALGASQEAARGSIRFGLGRFNTDEEIDYAAGRVVETVRKLRDLSPLYQMARKEAT